ncbi:MAG: hypothetical protein ABIE94_00630, partial [archaeon]
QDTLRGRITYHEARTYGFVKDAPIMAYRITSDRFEDIPEEIRRHIGAVDRTKYTQEYLRQNIGSVIALQMDGDKPDFYIIGKDTFDKKYRLVASAEVGQKNAKLMGRLEGVDGMKALVASGNANIVGVLKTVPVPMIRMSEIGYDTAEEVVIQSPWGEQTKPAGQDAFLVFDEGQDMYYMVNSDAEGNPLSYVPETVSRGINLQLVTKSELSELALVSKQIREEDLGAVPDSIRSLEFDTSSREAYFESVARYYEQQYGLPEGSLEVSYPKVPPLSGNEVLFLSKDGEPLAVIKIFLRQEEGLPYGSEALREIESLFILENPPAGQGVGVPEIYDIVSVNNMDSEISKGLL